MKEVDRLLMLEKENNRLKKENEVLLAAVKQMKVTLDRLLDRYVIRTDCKSDD